MRDTLTGLTHTNTHPFFNDSTDAILNGSTEAILNGSTETILNGSTETILNGSTEAILNGCTETILNGSTETILNGSTETILNGSTEAILNGSTETILNGSTEAILNGSTEAILNGSTETILNGTQVEDFLQRFYSKIQRSLENFVRIGSGWRVRRIASARLDFAKYAPLKGSSNIDLPDRMKNKMAVINIKNQYNKCLMWSLLSALRPVDEDAQRVSKYAPHENELKFDGIHFPTPLSQIPKVEKLNNAAINVLGYDAGCIHCISQKIIQKSRSTFF